MSDELRLPKSLRSVRYSLSSFASRLRPAIDRAPKEGSILDRAAWVAAAEFGERSIDGVNVSMLAVLTGGLVETWLCRPSASAVVHGTDLHSIPDAPPRLLRSHGCLEVRRPETGERLWGDVVSLAWYQHEGTTYLIGLTYPDGWAVARWRPRWTGGEIEEGLPDSDRSALVDPSARDQHDAFARDAARYLIVFALLAESESSPLRIEIDKRERERKTRHVYVADRPAAPRASSSEEIDGRVREATTVSGHLKRQRHGEGRALTKWIYVEGYSARRWYSPRWIVEKANTLNAIEASCADCKRNVPVGAGHVYYERHPLTGTQRQRVIHRDPAKCPRAPRRGLEVWEADE